MDQKRAKHYGKGLKILFLDQKCLNFCRFFEKFVGNPLPPFFTKVCKVVFERLPYESSEDANQQECF